MHITSLMRCDIDWVCELDQTVYEKHWSKEGFVQELNNPYVKNVAIRENLTSKSQGVAYLFYSLLGLDCYITNIVVSPSHRRRGLAKKMIQEVIRRAGLDHQKRVVLDVRVSNHIAISLYRSLGFLVLAERNGFYSDGENAYTMEIELHLKLKQSGNDSF